MHSKKLMETGFVYKGLAPKGTLYGLESFDMINRRHKGREKVFCLNPARENRNTQ
jgi:hypothetical protein